jgi:hypothetical protein
MSCRSGLRLISMIWRRPAVRDTAPDLIFTGGPVLTMDPARPRTEALAVRAGTITAVGDRDEVLALRGPVPRSSTWPAGRCCPGSSRPTVTQ